MKPDEIPTTNESVALYGGSFDPIHSAHLEVARVVLQQIPLARVVFIPAAQSPLKVNRAHASDSDRLEMLRLATEGNPQLELDACELERGGTSYTIDTVEAYLKAHPRVRLHWIIGADQFELLPRWRSIEALASMLTFIVLRRPGYSISKPQSLSLEYLEVDAPLMEHSSTEIRDRLASELSCKDLLPPAVEAFISSKGLYTR